MILRRVRLPESIFSVGADTLEANSMIAGHSGPNKKLDLSEPLHVMYLDEKPSVGYHHSQYIEGY